ncbi:putative reverse transcriptase domain-containing protein [Tanacetum coccineum]
MAASAIAISSDSLDESVGSPPSRVILFGESYVIPLLLVVDPETSLLLLLFHVQSWVETILLLYTGIDPYVSTVARWRSRVTARPLSLYEFPIAPVTASPGIRRRPTILIRPGEYSIEEVVSPSYLQDHRSSSSSSVSDSCQFILRSSLRDSSERPLHSSSRSAGPSRKRCRSPIDYVPSSTPLMGSLAPTRVDSFPPRIGDGDDVIDQLREEIVDASREDSSYSSSTRDDIVRSFEDMPIDLDDVVRDFYHHMSEVRIDRIVGIKTVQRRLEADQLIAKGQRVSMIERIDSLRLENLKVCRDRDDTRGRLRRNDNGGGDGNGNDTVSGNNRGDNGDGNENCNGNRRGDRPGARKCTYQDFMKCQPLSFKGTEGVLLKLMTEVYCPRNEIQKMETELWNLSVKNNDMATYTQRFQELTMMRTKMVPEEEDRVEKFIGDLLDNIQGNVITAEPTRLQDVVRIANHLMDKKLKGYANTGGQNVARAYTSGNNEKNGYGGTFPFCNRCKLHHEGQYTAKCHNYKRIGHLARDCRSVVTVTTQGTPGPNQRVVTCFECRVQGHYRKDCPKVKNQNHGNKARVPDARGKAYVVGGGDANLGSNTVTGTFLLNDHHAYMSFDSGADRSFISNNFSALLDIIPSALDVSYAVEIADERTLETNTVLRGCILGLLGHPFNIDPMPIDLGSFDVIIGMDWLAKNHAVIVCDLKIVRIPYENEILIVQGDKGDKEKKSTLRIISCEKAQKYMRKVVNYFWRRLR